MTFTLELPPEVEGALVEEAERTGLTPEEIIADDLRQKYAAWYEADQQRRHAVLAGLIAKAQALVPDPPDSPTRKACRASPN